MSFGPGKGNTRSAGAHATAVFLRSGGSAAEGGRVAAPLRQGPSGVSQLSRCRAKDRTVPFRAGNVVLSAADPGRVIQMFITLRPPNEVQGRFHTPVGEISGLIRQSQINGAADSVEAHATSGSW